MLSKSQEYRENASNCGELAADAKDLPSTNRYRRMQHSWLALAEEQDGWKEGLEQGHRKPRQRKLKRLDTSPLSGFGVNRAAKTCVNDHQNELF